MKALSRSSLDADVVIRAVGISLIVLDHATSVGRPAQILAGLNMLLMVSGYYFAKFLPMRPSKTDIARSFFSYGKAIWVPCFLALLASAVIYRKVDLPDLLFIGNLFHSDHVAFFPAWYPMELLQYMLLLSLFFYLPGVAAAYDRRPFLTISGLLVLAVAQRLALSKLWAAGYLDGGGPHVMLWNFVAGWLVFAAYSGDRYERLLRTATFLAIVALSWVTWGPYLMRFWTTIAAAAVLLIGIRITVPFAVSRIALLLSQATLAIFILHQPFIGLYNLLTGTTNSYASALFTLFGPMLLWVVFSAAIRAYRILSQGARAANSFLGGSRTA